MRLADEPIYLDAEDLLDARLRIAENDWKDFMDTEYPELILVESNNEFEDSDEKMNTLYRKFVYYPVDDVDVDDETKRKLYNGFYFVEFRDRLTEITNQYITLE